MIRRLSARFSELVSWVGLVLLVVALPGVMIMPQNTAGAQSAGRSTSFLRLIHTAPDAAAFDVYLNGELTFPGLAYQDISDLYPVGVQDYEVEVRNRNAPATAAPLLSQKITVLTNTHLTLLVYGRANGAGDDALALKLFRTERNIPEGRAFIEVYHAVPSLGALDVLAGDDERTSPVLENVGPGTFGLLPADEGSYQMRIAPTGLADQPLLDMGLQVFVTGIYYTYVIVGEPGNLSFIEAADGPLLAGALHLAPNAPPVDVYLNGRKTFSNLTFGDEAPFVQRDSATMVVEVRRAGDPTNAEPLVRNEFRIPAGVAANYMLIGSPDEQGVERLMIQAYWGAAAIPDGRMQIVLIHLSGSGPLVDLTIGPDVVMAGVDFENVRAIRGRPGTYQVRVRPTGVANQALAMLDDYEAQVGKNNYIVLYTSADGEGIEAKAFANDPYNVLVR